MSSKDTLSILDIGSLISKGNTTLKGMKSKAGNKFNAFIKLNEKGETTFEFENKKGKKN
ncbi:topoisomerase C-terminal repeat-containing protein [Chryseobacterium luteum]|uniref:topoisomerase C-terminal repeat-containing protein n=1 Tax=Chryseobacterium luteum TaxID=421531 RepID=UPI000AC40748|nr:topoisomerase C-terminal repeat-containing protein [Chryseobacterium luteum]